MQKVRHILSQPKEIAFIVWVGILLVVIAYGVYNGIQVFINGLVLTNLTNQVPWGLWITIDLSSIALAGGAFFLSALVYILGIKRFMPAARLAVFVGMLGYSAALVTLLVDIGRPDRFYHPMIHWNVHSMLWEVTMCITFYFSILSLEVFPLIVTHKFFDRLPRVRELAHTIHKGAPILAFMGLFFSLLHQSSLGATYGVVLARPIWFRPTMPLLFITSAIFGGSSLTIALALVIGWLRGREIVPRDVLYDIGKIAGSVLLIFLYMRFWDYTAGNYGYVPLRTEASSELFGGPMALTFWAWEIFLGGIVAAGLMIWSGIRKSDAGLFVGAGMAVIGLVVHRWNTTMIGFLTPLSTDPQLSITLTPQYTPALVEWAVGLGIIAGITLVFTLGIRYLPAFELTSGENDSHIHATS